MFDDGVSPLPWLQEKTLSALTTAAHLADLANEPDTTAWYAKTLRGEAQSLVARLAPVVAFLHEAGSDAATHAEWEPIAEGGSLALARWCKKWKIADPRTAGMGAVASEWEDADREAKAEGEALPARSVERTDGAFIKLEVYGALTGRLLDEDLPSASHRLLTFLLHRLWHSRFADAVAISQRFLPGDTGLEPEETAAAYRDLYDRGMLDPVEAEDGKDQRVWRLVVEGINESKHRLPFSDASFGYPGARIDGQRTMGNIILVELTEAMTSALTWWGSAENLLEMSADLQQKLGENRVFIESVESKEFSGKRRVEVRLRYLPGEDETVLRGQVQIMVEAWLRERVGSPIRVD
jgi:hypothetical protein